MPTLSPGSLRSLRPAAAETFDWQGRTVILRALRPEDGALLRVLATHVAAADLGFSGPVSLEITALAVKTRSLCEEGGPSAFIAADLDEDGHCEALGFVQARRNDAGGAADLAIALRHDVKRRRLGRRLVAKTLEVLHGRGVRCVGVRVLAGDEAMRSLLREVGFVMDPRQAEPGRLVYLHDAALASGAGPSA